MLVVADTLLNYDLNETFLVQVGVLRALNQLPRDWEQRGVVGARCPCGCKTYWINNISSIICLHEVTAHFYSRYAFSQHALMTNDISDTSLWLCGEFLGKSALCGERRGCEEQGISFRTRTVFKWKPQAVQTRWQCKWLLLMTVSPFARVLIKNRSFSSLPLKW